MAIKKTKSKKRIDASTPEAFYSGLFDVIAQRGWFDLTLPQIARGCGMTLAELLRRAPDKHALLAGFGAFLDEQLALDDADNAGEPLKDRLFDVLMRRFDGLRPFRGGLIRLMEDMQAHPVSAAMLGLEHACGYTRSIMRLTEMAGVSTSQPRGLMLVGGLKLVYLLALRAWRKDDSQDMSATMAALDKGLERLLKLLRLS